MSKSPCEAGGWVHEGAQRLLEWVRQARERAKGRHVVYSAVFCVLEAIRTHGWPLKETHYISEGNQIRMSRNRFKEVLERALGPERVSRLALPSEGGRTTRSAPRVARDLVGWLESVLPDSPPPGGWGSLADCWELVVAEEYERHMRAMSAIRVPKPDPRHPLSEFVRQVLEAAGRDRRGAVAHHLVGAKLAIRFPSTDWGGGLAPRSYRAADRQADAPGDYWYGDTVFHVTVSPAPELFEKCLGNLAGGMRVWVITPQEKIDAARALAESTGEGLTQRLQIISISDFVGQNLEEIGGFSVPGVAQEAEKLVSEYNRRIDEAENGDPSLKIEFGS